MFGPIQILVEFDSNDVMRHVNFL